MALANVRGALQVEGRLCWNPTDIGSSGAFPWGGTDLGFMTNHAVDARIGQHVVRAEELGEAVEIIHAGEELVFAALMSEWNVDALNALALDSTTGAATGRALVRGRAATDAVRQGSKASARAGILYFSPRSDSQPGVLFHDAIPIQAETARLEFNIANRFGMPWVWIARPDATHRVYSIGLREDLTL